MCPLTRDTDTEILGSPNVLALRITTLQLTTAKQNQTGKHLTNEFLNEFKKGD